MTVNDQKDLPSDSASGSLKGINPRHSIMPHVRAKQILRLFYENGRLSTNDLHAIIRPVMERKSLRAALKRLRKRGLITRRYDPLFGVSAVYHEISKSVRSKRKVLEILGLPPASIQPRFRREELIHSSRSGAWVVDFKSLFPTARILRDYQILKDEQARVCLQLDHKYNDGLWPDLLLILPAPVTQSQHVALAVVFEKMRKSDRSLIKKIKTYATRTLVQGLIYFCDKEDIDERLRQVHQSRVLQRSKRIKHYAPNFVLLGLEDLRGTDSEVFMVNAALQKVSVTEWASFLTAQLDDSRAVFSAPMQGPWASPPAIEIGGVSELELEQI